jgi:hypothetical protein
MSKRLPVPKELEILIEKRDVETDRRRGKRRGASSRRTVSQGPLGAAKTVADADDPPAEERRRAKDRRRGKERRQNSRRKEDG